MHRSLAQLIGARCVIHDVAVGEVVAVLVDADCSRAIGLDVRLPDGAHRFLPWVAVEFDDRHVRSHSAFLLVDVGDSYVRLGARALHDVDELARLRAEPDGTLQPALPQVVSSPLFAGTRSG